MKIKKYSQCLFFLFLSVNFSGCYKKHNSIFLEGNSPNNSSINEGELNDNSIGLTVYEQIHGGKKLEITFALSSNNIANADNFVGISVDYEGFSPDYDNTKASLDFILADGMKISLTRPALSQTEKKTLNEYRESFKSMFRESIGFLMSKQDFRKLVNSGTVLFKFSALYTTISGSFLEKEMTAIKKVSSKLLNSRPYKGQTLKETKKELENLEQVLKEDFKDFRVLSYHAERQDIANYYNVKLNSTFKNPQTHHIEEVIYPKIEGKELGPLILGFNDSYQLVYITDYFDEDRIIWLKPKKSL